MLKDRVSNAEGLTQDSQSEMPVHLNNLIHNFLYVFAGLRLKNVIVKNARVAILYKL